MVLTIGFPMTQEKCLLPAANMGFLKVDPGMLAFLSRGPPPLTHLDIKRAIDMVK